MYKTVAEVFLGQNISVVGSVRNRQKQSLEVLHKTGVLKNVAKLTGKLLRWSLFLNKVTN